MGLFDKAKNKAQQATGKGKEAVGDATNDDSTKMEGQADQVKASGKDKLEDVKDQFDN
ncbi:MAG TPA: CsbD family protein [Flexivirga sp.]|uniref:CsbD family protein n=1 Tax=Flexivirga sp. TaxID=1962927 RepID=UPI002BEB6A24|nr:CsbD family protein [Flexivirga sp.]HWC22261.1 CsbD family protein [Flexivirga sp.]